MSVFGFLKGFQPFEGYNYSAQKYERVREARQAVLKWKTLFCGLYALIMILFLKNILAAFSTDPIVNEI